MKRYTVTAEHTQGKSVDHCCTNGVYSDPTDEFEWTGEAENANDAERLAFIAMGVEVKNSTPCECKRHLQAGSEAWYKSVVLAARNEAGQLVIGEDDEVINP